MFGKNKEEKIIPGDVKAQSEKIVLEKGGKICDWLPVIERDSIIRSNDDLINRALILNALLNIYFKAPIPIIKEWLEKYNLLPFLTKNERELLSKDNKDLKEQELVNIYWYIEALWAFM